MVLPKFFCVGAAKSGTTTLQEILIQHPDIFLPDVKETHFFVSDKLYQKGLSFYEKEFFYNYKGEKLVGEIEANYMFVDSVAYRIAKDLGKNIKFIFMLRNPADRAYSHYLMNVRRALENKSFEEAIKLEEERKKIGYIKWLKYAYISRGLYFNQVKRFMEIFPKGNMFFIIFEEDFLKNREKTIKSLLEFLGVSSNVELNLNIKSNAASKSRLKFLAKILYSERTSIPKRIGRLIFPNTKIRRKVFRKLDRFNRALLKTNIKLAEDFKRQIIEIFFKEDILKLQDLIGKDLTNWFD